MGNLKIENWPFSSCLLSDLAFRWQRGWRWPCFDTFLTALMSYKCSWLAVEQFNLYNKTIKVCIKTMWPPALLPFKDQVTKHTTGLMNSIVSHLCDFTRAIFWTRRSQPHKSKEATCLCNLHGNYAMITGWSWIFSGRIILEDWQHNICNTPSILHSSWAQN